MSRATMRPFRPGVFITILISLFCVYIAIPFMWMFSTSIRSPLLSFRMPPAIFPTMFDLENYRMIFIKVPNFMMFVTNSIKLSVSITALQLIVCSMAAYAFSRLRFPGRNLLFVMFLVALMIPAQVTNIPRFIFISRLKLINTHESLIIPAMYSTMAIFLIRQHMMTIPKSYDEAAYMDGASKIWTFLRVIVPMAKPSMIVISVMTFIATWNDYSGPLIYINSMSKMPLPLGLQSITGMFGSGNQASVIAAVILSLIPPLIFYIVGQRAMIDGIQLGGLKG